MFNLKGRLMQWLEVPPSINTKNLVTRNQVKSEVQEAIIEAVQDRRANSWDDDYHIYGIFREAVVKAFLPDIKDMLEKRIAQKIDTEQFIDDIVKRIKVKQLR